MFSDEFQTDTLSYLLQAFDNLPNPHLPEDQLVAYQMDGALILSNLDRHRKRAKYAAVRRDLDRLRILTSGLLYAVNQRLEKAGQYE